MTIEEIFGKHGFHPITPVGERIKALQAAKCQKDLFDLMIKAIHELPSGKMVVRNHVGETLDEQVALHQERKCGCKFFTPAEIVMENRRRESTQ